ncbi:hypothetical protein [Curtobacterium sp. VKM Ac-1376]|uniref:hypothetical protein n=1 Tax=Curtobacterium sp. VKM Ac-1376 TaxID=123312 RepID=UPI00188B11D3|nr:hypothetical protein [Curtobacterium sp. VKM Ac-1376]MBF4615824.1 hypothetical protein [Curtobacterium sp. VKM Ac-1376]
MFNGLILVQNLLLVAGAAAPQFARVVTGDASALISRIFLALFVIEVVFLVPVLVVRGRRARRYAEAATADNDRRTDTPVSVA